MGNFQLEIFKMAMYVMFPVGTFFIYNQTTWFEDWIVEQKRKMHPPDDTPEILKFREFMEDYKNKRETKLLEDMQFETTKTKP